MSCKTILMTEEQWANSQFSIVRRYGSCSINGEFFIIVDKRGKDIFECSLEAAYKYAGVKLPKRLRK